MATEQRLQRKKKLPSRLLNLPLSRRRKKKLLRLRRLLKQPKHKPPPRRQRLRNQKRSNDPSRRSQLSLQPFTKRKSRLWSRRAKRQTRKPRRRRHIVATGPAPLNCAARSPVRWSARSPKSTTSTSSNLKAPG